MKFSIKTKTLLPILLCLIVLLSMVFSVETLAADSDFALIVEETSNLFPRALTGYFDLSTFEEESLTLEYKICAPRYRIVELAFDMTYDSEMLELDMFYTPAGTTASVIPEIISYGNTTFDPDADSGVEGRGRITLTFNAGSAPAADMNGDPLTLIKVPFQLYDEEGGRTNINLRIWTLTLSEGGNDASGTGTLQSESFIYVVENGVVNEEFADNLGLETSVTPHGIDMVELADIAAAKVVTDMINGLSSPADVKESDKNAIEAARTAYNDLTDKQKAKITPSVYKKLTDCEAALNALANKHKITIDMGGHGDNITLEVNKGANLYEALKSLNLTNKTSEGYLLACLHTKPLSEMKAASEYQSVDVVDKSLFDTAVTKDTTVYAIWLKIITLDAYEIKQPTDESSKIEVVVPEDAHFTITDPFWASDYPFDGIPSQYEKGLSVVGSIFMGHYAAESDIGYVIDLKNTDMELMNASATGFVSKIYERIYGYFDYAADRYVSGDYCYKAHLAFVVVPKGSQTLTINGMSDFCPDIPAKTVKVGEEDYIMNFVAPKDLDISYMSWRLNYDEKYLDVRGLATFHNGEGGEVFFGSNGLYSTIESAASPYKVKEGDSILTVAFRVKAPGKTTVTFNATTEKKPYKLTVDWGGFFENDVFEVNDGENAYDVLYKKNNILIGILKKDKNRPGVYYEMVNVLRKPLSEVTSSYEYFFVSLRDNLNFEIHEDTTVYAIWLEFIDDIDIEPPVAGTTSERVGVKKVNTINHELYSNQPSVLKAAGQHFSYVSGVWYEDDNGTRSAQNINGGTFKAGEKYHAYLYLIPEIGYLFPSSNKIHLSGDDCAVSGSGEIFDHTPERYSEIFVDVIITCKTADEVAKMKIEKLPDTDKLTLDDKDAAKPF